MPDSRAIIIGVDLLVERFKLGIVYLWPLVHAWAPMVSHRECWSVIRYGKYQIHRTLLAGLRAYGEALRQVVKHIQSAQGA